MAQCKSSRLTVDCKCQLLCYKTRLVTAWLGTDLNVDCILLYSNEVVLTNLLMNRTLSVENAVCGLFMLAIFYLVN